MDDRLNESLDALVRSATAAANQGRWDEAEGLWRRVRALDPAHPQASFSLGVHAFRHGRLTEARELLEAAQRGAPRDPSILLSLAVVLREQGDTPAEMRALDAALAVDPYFLPGLLAKGASLERQGRTRAAANVFRNALKVAPPEPQWLPALRPQLQQAQARVQQHGQALAQFLEERMGATMQRLTPFERERWSEAGAVLAGQSPTYPSVCASLQVPRLPAIPFFAREQFAWAEALEAQTAAITAELHAALAAEQEEFRPYVAYAPGTPVNQWHELNHSRRWSSYFLWRDGAAVEAHQARCPITTRALRDVEMADIGGLCPNVMFSALAPHTHIPPHTGETNARVVVHLPLVVPEHCLYRVGFERRRWQVGQILVFDDSIEHEARNDSDELRVVLIFDVWNPLLSRGERDMVRAVSAATRDFMGRGP